MLTKKPEKWKKYSVSIFVHEWKTIKKNYAVAGEEKRNNLRLHFTVNCDYVKFLLGFY